MDDPAGEAAAALIDAHFLIMRATSPAGSIHAIDAAGLTAPDVSFYLAREGETVLAMGALRRLDPTHGELKSMHTAVAARGRGVAAALLCRLIGEARAFGLTRLSLETGTHEAFAASRRLYARAGFTPCGPFASYRPDPHSCFMTRAL